MTENNIPRLDKDDADWNPEDYSYGLMLELDGAQIQELSMALETWTALLQREDMDERVQSVNEMRVMLADELSSEIEGQYEGDI